MNFGKKKKELQEYTIANENILEVRDLHVDIRVDDYVLNAVRGVNFRVKKGETLGLVGESGCGKSVTSKQVLGINPDNCIGRGQILYRTKSGKVLNLLELEKDGAVYRGLRGAQIAMIFQEPMTAFSPLYTIGNQLAEIIRLHETDISKEAARERVLEMLKKVGIANPEKRIDQYPHEFSGGMLQRALIAMMLSCNPDFLVADEPTTALDVTIQAQILELMKNLQREFGMSILFITHDLGTVANMCDKVAVMYLGRIVEYGTVHQIFHNPRHPYTKGLLRSLPRMDQSREDKLYVIEGTVPLPVNMPPSCGFWDRCAHRIEGLCSCRDIAEYMVEPGHMVRCVLMEE